MENYVQFYSKDDLSIGYNLSMAEKRIKEVSEGDQPTEIDRVVELWHIRRLFKENCRLQQWTDEDFNQHVMRIVPATDDIAGYIYCWLNTDYAYRLIVRNTYGSVVDEIDDQQLAQVVIPLLKNETKQKEINDKILQANELRYQAYTKEQEAIQIMENVLD